MKKNKSFIIALAFAGVYFPALADMSILNQRCEYLPSPLGIDTKAPRLTWEVISDTPVKDFSVDITDSYTGKKLWSSGRLPADVRMVAPNLSLKSDSRYDWTVKARDGRGKITGESKSSFETGKFQPKDWTGKWISDKNDKEFEPAPMFRKEFQVSDGFDKAKMYVSAAGYYVVYINGERVGDSHMDPGYTHYDKRNLYATHDVTGLLHPGTNVITAVLGNGFYNCQSKAVWDFETARWRNRPALLCEIVTSDKKGKTTTAAATDSSWLTATGPYTYNNIYSGDRYDGRKAPANWTGSDFDATGWSNAVELAAPSPALRAQSMPSIRPVETITPELLKSWGDTVFIFDMGKNIAGVTSMRVSGEKGTHFVISSGEMLKNNGRLQQGNIDIYYRPEKPGERFQTDEFILAGTGKEEVFKPEFTYHGFKYVEVKSDRPVKLTGENLTGMFMHTDVKPVGSFNSSNELLNRIYDATMLSYLGNLHSIPTDCPQREKNGWTADAHVAIDLALLNFDGITLYEKWMNDFIDNQRESGNIAGIIPSAGWGYGDWPGPVWDAALFIIPDAIYKYYGDKRVIENLYPTFEKYFDWCAHQENEEGLLTNGIGDWLSYNAQTPTDFTSSVYYYLDNRYMAEFAKLLGKDSGKYEAKAAELRDRINSKYFDKSNNSYSNGTQTALALALYAGLVPAENEKAVAANLRKAVADNRHFLNFGLLGSKTVLRMLTKYGYVDDAYEMATKTDAPSWGFWIEKYGYGTLPETWTLHPEFHDASINHVFMGDISAWMTNDLAGINYDSENPGFSNVIIRPHFPKGLDSAKATYHSVKGNISSEWKRSGDSINLTVEIPTGCTATVITDKELNLHSGKHNLKFDI